MVISETINLGHNYYMYTYTVYSISYFSWPWQHNSDIVMCTKDIHNIMPATCTCTLYLKEEDRVSQRSTWWAVWWGPFDECPAPWSCRERQCNQYQPPYTPVRVRERITIISNNNHIRHCSPVPRISRSFQLLLSHSILKSWEQYIHVGPGNEIKALFLFSFGCSS